MIKDAKDQKRKAAHLKAVLSMPGWTEVLEPYLMEETTRLTRLMIETNEVEHLRQCQIELRALKGLTQHIYDLAQVKTK